VPPQQSLPAHKFVASSVLRKPPLAISELRKQHFDVSRVIENVPSLRKNATSQQN
jgi:hypothetical protein